MCLCFCAGGVQGRQETRPYFTYFAYFVYLPQFTYYAYYAFNSVCCTARLATCHWQSIIVYQCSESSQVLHVIPVSSILGLLPLVPLGSTWTIPYEMQRESADFPGASCYTTKEQGRMLVVVSQQLGPRLGNKAMMEINKGTRKKR